MEAAAGAELLLLLLLEEEKLSKEDEDRGAAPRFLGIMKSSGARPEGGAGPAAPVFFGIRNWSLPPTAFLDLEEKEDAAAELGEEEESGLLLLLPKGTNVSVGTIEDGRFLVRPGEEEKDEEVKEGLE